jgi:thiamine phosphate synthase YjbQ (UPF0047 family)
METTEITLENRDRHVVDLTEAAAACSGSEPDLDEALERLLPRDDRYRHRHGSPGHGADHLLPVFVSPSLVIPVVGGRMALGTWQSLVLVDLNRDNPHRLVRLSFVAG